MANSLPSSSFPSMFSLQNQQAIVTGCGRGIGEHMAIALAEAGADIIFVQRNNDNLPVHDAVRTLGREILIHIADLSDKTQVAQVIPTIMETCKNIRHPHPLNNWEPTILLNCAGIQRRHPAEAFPDNDWDEVIQVNLSTVFTLSRDFGAALLAGDANLGGQRGSIINIASLMSFQGGLNVPAYAAAKGGVAQLTKALSNEWAGKGINVNAIAPGYVATDLTSDLMRDVDRAATILARIPAGRWGKPEDFKGVVVFLASAGSRYVSGEIITVDGGWMGR